MREVWRMWNYATMLVLTVLTASLFAAILIPFKGNFLAAHLRTKISLPQACNTGQASLIL
jgi:hypothetical protein